MLKRDNLAREDELILHFLILDLPVADYLPFIEILGHVAFTLLVHFVWIDSSLR
jgi:hypothetical protein